MVTSRQLTVSSTRRDAWVEVDLGAIEHNVGIITSWLDRQDSADSAKDKPSQRAAHQPKLMAVVKSDAYGHGAMGVAEVLVGSGASWLAVASIDEGVQIRGVDSKTPILLLSPVPVWAIRRQWSQAIDLSITSISQIKRSAEARRRATKTQIHLKFDTGMHRLGIPYNAVEKALER